MRDRVETAFGIDRLLVLRQQSCGDGNVGRNNIFVQEFAKQHQSFSALYGMHIHAAHMRRLDVLSTPILGRTATDDVPTEIVVRVHLRRNDGCLLDGPLHLPFGAVFHEVKIASAGRGSDNGGPLHLKSHIGVSTCRMERLNLEVAESCVSTKIGPTAGEIAMKLLLAELALIRKIFVGALECVCSNLLAEGAYSCFRRTCRGGELLT